MNPMELLCIPASTLPLAQGRRCFFEGATRPDCKQWGGKSSGGEVKSCEAHEATVKPSSSCGRINLLADGGKKRKSLRLVFCKNSA